MALKQKSAGCQKSIRQRRSCKSRAILFAIAIESPRIGPPLKARLLGTRQRRSLAQGSQEPDFAASPGGSPMIWLARKLNASLAKQNGPASCYPVYGETPLAIWREECHWIFPNTGKLPLKIRNRQPSASLPHTRPCRQVLRKTVDRDTGKIIA